MPDSEDSPDNIRHDAPAPEPTRYRLVVGSAAEAVALVRERFGGDARVVSVRQIEAGGLKRFLQKPRLEVIVEVGTLTNDATLAGSKTKGRDDADPEIGDGTLAASHAGPAPEPSTAPRLRRQDPEPDGTPAGARTEIALLRATGIDESLLARVRADHAGLDWNTTPPPEALATLAAWLRRQYDAIPRRPAGSRRVFLGCCGVGKTTALCKVLALDVFVRGQSVAVLKLDGEQPNASDGLAAFCDVLGAPLLRSAGEVEEFDRGTRLYLDMPGVGLDAHAEHARLAQTLDALRVDTRVLVVNAACETEVIQDTWEVGRACGATHVVFTHVDELRRPGKLWRFVLNGGLRPLFLSAGPSPAGEIEEDVFGALLARTFPPSVARAAAPAGRAR